MNIVLLDNVCRDCCDFLNHFCVEQEDCPVFRLKKRFKNADIINFIEGK